MIPVLHGGQINMGLAEEGRYVGNRPNVHACMQGDRIESL